MPPHETSASPVDVNVAMPRYFGITPPTLLFGSRDRDARDRDRRSRSSRTGSRRLVLAVGSCSSRSLLFLGVAGRKPDTARRAALRRATFERARDRAAWLVQATTVRTEAGRKLTRAPPRVARARRSAASGGCASSARPCTTGDDEAAKRVTEELNRSRRAARERRPEIDGDRRIRAGTPRAGRLRVAADDRQAVRRTTTSRSPSGSRRSVLAMARRLLLCLRCLLVLAAPAAGDDIHRKKRDVDERISSLHSKIAHAKAQEGVLTQEITVVNAKIASLQDDVASAQSRAERARGAARGVAAAARPGDGAVRAADAQARAASPRLRHRARAARAPRRSTRTRRPTSTRSTSCSRRRA